MKEIGMIFNGEMVRAISDGRKTQTRRVIDIPEYFNYDADYGIGKLTKSTVPSMRRYIGRTGIIARRVIDGLNEVKFIPAPCEKGDRIYVRETHYLYGHWVKNGYSKTGKQKWKFIADRSQGARFPENTFNIKYKKTEKGWFKRPSIHMPKKVARIWLEVEEVGIERLQDISEADAKAEGCPVKKNSPLSAKDDFAALWRGIYGFESWDANPWVWVIKFKRI